MSDVHERYLIVRLLEEHTIGVVISLGAHFSRVRFQDAGHSWEVDVDNDDFEIIDSVDFLHKEI